MGLPRVANKNMGHPVKLEFQISNDFLSISMSHVLHEIYIKSNLLFI